EAASYRSQRAEYEAAECRGADRAELVLEGRDDAEVGADPAQAPEEVGVLIGAGGDQLADVVTADGRHQVVAGEAEAAHQGAEVAAEGEAADAGRGDDAAGGRQAERLGLAVELAPVGAPLGSGGAPCRVDPDPVQPPEVDQQGALGDGLAGHAV